MTVFRTADAGKCLTCLRSAWDSHYRARTVPANRAFQFVAGYTCANDVTARDLQRGDGQYLRC